MGRNSLSLVMVLTVVLAGGMWAPTLWGDERKPGEADIGEQKETGKGKSRLAIKDLPAPIPKVMDEIQRIGNEVGEGISKATGAGAEAVKKTFEKKSE